MLKSKMSKGGSSQCKARCDSILGRTPEAYRKHSKLLPEVGELVGKM